LKALGLKEQPKNTFPLFQEILKAKKQLVILYGISEKDEHDIQTLDRVKELQQQQYKDNFKLIHLPTHFGNY
jgi:2-iminoacetate synthase ThiH